MFAIDNRTLVLVVFLIMLLMVGALAYFTHGARRYPGQRLWLWANSLQCLGFLLMFFQGLGDRFFSIFLANMALVGSMSLIMMGLGRFFSIRILKGEIVACLAAAAAFYVYFTFMEFDTTARIVGLSFFAAYLTGKSAWILKRGKEITARSYRTIGAAVFGGCAAIHAFRGIATLFVPQPAGQTMLSPNPLTSIAMLLASVVVVAWTIVIMSLVSGRIDQERQKLIEELRRSLAEVNTLEGLIPICSNCHNVRDDQGFWQKVEKYVMARSSAQFSHGICPDCLRKLYPDIAGEVLGEAGEIKPDLS